MCGPNHDVQGGGWGEVGRQAERSDPLPLQGWRRGACRAHAPEGAAGDVQPQVAPTAPAHWDPAPGSAPERAGGSWSPAWPEAQRRCYCRL